MKYVLLAASLLFPALPGMADDVPPPPPPPAAPNEPVGPAPDAPPPPPVPAQE